MKLKVQFTSSGNALPEGQKKPKLVPFPSPSIKHVSNYPWAFILYIIEHEWAQWPVQNKGIEQPIRHADKNTVFGSYYTT